MCTLQLLAVSVAIFIFCCRIQFSLAGNCPTKGKPTVCDCQNINNINYVMKCHVDNSKYKNRRPLVFDGVTADRMWEEFNVTQSQKAKLSIDLTIRDTEVADIHILQDRIVRNSKQRALTFTIENMPTITTSELYFVNYHNEGKNYYDKVVIRDVFKDVSQGRAKADILDLRPMNVWNKGEFVVADTYNVSVNLSDPIVFNPRKKPARFEIKNNKLYNAKLHIVVTGEKFSLSWDNKKIFPFLFYANGSRVSRVDEVNLQNGAKYLCKETLIYFVNIRNFTLSEKVQRVEYGTLANPLFGVKALNWDSTFRSNFQKGICYNTDANICAICLMHQYSLHRTNDKVDEKCKALKPDEKLSQDHPMKTCYWRATQSFPAAVLDGYNVKGVTIDRNVPVCPDIPKDLWDYFTAMSRRTTPRAHMFQTTPYVEGFDNYDSSNFERDATKKKGSKGTSVHVHLIVMQSFPATLFVCLSLLRRSGISEFKIRS